MRNGLPFSKPKVRLFGDPGEAQQYLGEAYNLLFKVRQFCEQSGVPVFSMQRQLPNGALVTAAIVGAEEIVSAFPPANGRPVEVRRGLKKIPYFLANFYGTPSSEDHPAGYVPQHPQHPEAQYPGPVSVWAKYNRDNVPPAPAPKTPEDKNELTPAHPIEEQPGNCTWWSELVKFKGEPVVLSWKHPFGMQGRYGFVSTTVFYPRPDGLFNIYDYGFLDSLNPVKSATPNGTGSAYTNLSGRQSVWLNGARINFDNLFTSSIYGAALRYDKVEGRGEELMIYVVTKSGATLWLHKCPVPSATLAALKSGAKDFDFSKAETVSLTPVKSLNKSVQVVQPCFFNASATACTTIAVLSGIDGFEHSSYPDYGDNQDAASVLEWVFDNPSVSVIKTAYVQVDYQQAGKRYSNTDESVGIYNGKLAEEFVGGSIYSSENVSVLAADYEGDTLVYIYSEVTTVEKSDAYSYSKFETGAGSTVISTSGNIVVYQLVPRAINITASVSPGNIKTTARLIHSRKGVIEEQTRSSQSGDGYSFSSESTLTGTYTRDNSLRITVANDIEATGNFVLIGYESDGDAIYDYPRISAGTLVDANGEINLAFSVLGGDLRLGSFLYEIVEESDIVRWNLPMSLKKTGALTYFGRSEEEPASGEREYTFKSTVFFHTGQGTIQLAQADIKPSALIQLNEEDSSYGMFTGGYITGYGTDVAASQRTVYRVPNLAKSINQHYDTPLELGEPGYSVFDRTKCKYVSFAADASGDYAYFGFCQPDTWVDPKEINAFKIKNTLHILEPETYAPGNFSTLSEPVFFGKVFDREDNIPDD